jgi:hypothetical protein
MGYEERVAQDAVVRSELRGAAEAALEVWAQAGQCIRWPVEGSSMWPMLRDGEAVVVAHGIRPFSPGDILLYRAGNGLILHRLLARQAGDRLVLAGDTHPHSDPAIPLGAVLGRAIAVEAGGREYSLDSRAARMAGRLLAASHPLRSRRGLQYIAAGLARIATWMVRLRASPMAPD